MRKISVFSKKYNKTIAVKAKTVSAENPSVLGWTDHGWSKSGGWVQM